jgi:putative membrane protein
MITLTDLPQLNAVLNSIATLFLLAGFVFIRRKDIQAHMRMMWSAVVVSALFLTSYLIFHYQVGSVGYDGTGWIRPVYFTILISHIILAIVNLPMILLTMYRAIRKDFQKHRKIARWTWPVWMYVSVTGVVVYIMMELSGSYDKLYVLP